MKEIKKSIYKIVTSTGSGTGFKVRGLDYLITNFHVIAGHKAVAVEDHDRNRYEAHVIMANPEVDLAFLEVSGLEDKPGYIKLPQQGYEITEMQKVYICGFPFGMPYTITEGIISSKDQPMGGRKYIQTDAAVNPGNSGGPMLDEEGIMMGVTTAKFTEADNVGFAIKYTDVLAEIKDFHFTDNRYRVRCNSCGYYLEEEAKYCPSCGNDIDPVAFQEIQLSQLGKFVEQALSEMDINPILCRVARDYWSFYRGSAYIYIRKVSDNFLFAAAPINELPKGEMEKLLEYITSDPVSPYGLSIGNNTIYLTYICHLFDLHTEFAEDIKEALKGLWDKADELDDYLHENYNCPYSMQSKTSIKKEQISMQPVHHEGDVNISLQKNVSTERQDEILNRLAFLKDLFEKKLIDKEEYKNKKSEILQNV